MRRGAPALPATLPAPERIGVVLRHRSPDARETVDRLRALCAARGATVCIEPHWADAWSGYDALDVESDAPDLIVSMGGDGTLLRAARVAVRHRIPIMGINLGHLGFLTSATVDGMDRAMDHVFAGRACLDVRFTVEAERFDAAGAVREPPLVALNDVVVHRPGAARITELRIEVGEGDDLEEIGSFGADGIILATPTGSTAYSLSAQGPIMGPDVPAIILNPICPHSLSVRPLVVPDTERVRIRPVDVGEGLSLTVDGQVTTAIEPGDVVEVRRSPWEVGLVRLPGQTFFGTLRRKLGWAARSETRGSPDDH